jgi:uncharacterized protein (TIGR02266 family)
MGLILCLQAEVRSGRTLLMQILSTPRNETKLASHERRRYQRYAVRCRCWLESESASLFAQTVDVGLGGLFLRTGVPLPEGAAVGVTLELSHGGQRLHAQGIVSRSVPPRSGTRHGMGVELLHVDEGLLGLERLLGR